MDSEESQRYGGKKDFQEGGSESVMLDKEKQQERGKQGWPDAGKGTGHGGDKKVIALDRHKWMPNYRAA